MTPAGIEPATFRFVAQRLNHCATAVTFTFLKSFLLHIFSCSPWYPKFEGNVYLQSLSYMKFLRHKRHACIHLTKQMNRQLQQCIAPYKVKIHTVIRKCKCTVLHSVAEFGAQFVYHTIHFYGNSVRSSIISRSLGITVATG